MEIDVSSNKVTHIERHYSCNITDQW